MEEVSEGKKSKDIINSTLFFAALTGYAYFIWFEFEMGICSVYDIPTYLITVSMPNILIFATTLFTVILSSVWYLDLTTPLLKKGMQNEERVHKIYFINGILLVVFIFIVMASPFSWGLILGLFILLLIINILSWGILFLFYIRKKGSFDDKLGEVFKSNTDTKYNFLTVFGKPTHTSVTIILLIMLLPLTTFFIGWGNALSRTEYQSLYNKPNILVLKKYDDLLVCRNVNRKTKTLGDSLLLIKISDTLLLKSDKIGRLKLK
ncbi:MAG: hypothetical protein QM737_02815 [Ferruginibacter sp.]